MPAPPEQPVVLVTGSEGLIGRAVARRLAGRYHVVGTDRQAPYEGHAEDFVMMDLGSDLGVRQALVNVRERFGNRLASVVHLAAYYDFTGADSPLYEQVTVEGTRRLLRMLREDFEVEQFLFSSTMLVHPPVEPGEAITEDDPLEGTWPYPKSKVATERVIHAERDGIPAVLLRIAGVYTDYGQQPTLVQQIKRIYERDLEGHLFPGDPHTGQSLVHLDDAVDAIARAVDRRAALPEEVAILVGEPEPPTYDQLQDRIGALLWGKDWTTVRIPEVVAEAGAWVQERLPWADPFIKPFMIPMADDHYALDVSRAEALLGWRPRHRLLDTLPTIIEHLRRDPAGWYERNGLEPPDEFPELPPPVTPEAGHA
ncbi:MAG TPA: NAD(P)-dependent oxidoreductase [Rubricoccaceae bacterium]|nr:NAD(P)-dependent oxidoreductase [Rubricoccaceae bacterium]